jgi:hypothetical protein
LELAVEFDIALQDDAIGEKRGPVRAEPQLDVGGVVEGAGGGGRRKKSCKPGMLLAGDEDCDYGSNVVTKMPIVTTPLNIYRITSTTESMSLMTVISCMRINILRLRFRTPGIFPRFGGRCPMRLGEVSYSSCWLPFEWNWGDS